jgi:ankyrin repeat protein
MTPLHRAIEFKCYMELVGTLLAACPIAATVKNAGGMTPLHLSVEFNAPVVVYKALLNAYPEGTS